MTTKPKAKKFRIRRSGTPGNSPGATAAPGNPDDAAEGDGPAVAGMTPEQQIAGIRKEGLTGRQLRMARRVAQKHGLAPTSDFDAVRLLRDKGIDPFQRANMLELVVAEGQQRGGAAQNQLPQTVPQDLPAPPAQDFATEGARAREIIEIQRDIARRRRRKLVLLITRLMFFVFLPTLLAGYYYYVVATPMYATKSEFVIQKAESQMSSGLGGMFAGTQFATAQDSVTVQSYLQSRDAMLRLDHDLGFKSHFSQDWIDPIQRLDADASNEAAYRLYNRHIKIGFDPTEGIIKMEVIAADPAVSAAYAKALIGYAEEQVDNLTQRLREDQMRGARESYEDAEVAMRAAQRRVIELQEKSKVISGDVEVSLLTGLISTLELELTKDELSLEELLANPRPNRAKVEPLERKIQSLSAKIASLRAELTVGNADGDSIARISSELAVAETDLETRNLMMQQALQQLETARIEANRQTRYLSQGVEPVATDEATYPRKFENTILAFLIFAGIYLMLSLTASILREQVTS